ncbi:LOW QUALITY PROTEIN: cilia- and flagella-associated protein 221 [Leptodactylus fuscus]
MEVAAPAKFIFPKGDGRLKKPSTSSSSFLDSLVEKAMVRPAPDHLLESRVYMKLGSNVSVAADPGILHFGGFEIGRSLHQVLRLVNVSADVSSVHIIPPQSGHFTITYKKASRLAPGLALTVHVQFMADEWRYYYDCIRVHCKGDETLLVPLHAYPAMDLLDFPSHVNLSDVPLGESAHYILPLRCASPVDFEFCIVCSQPHKDFEISPTSGVIPGGGDVAVTVLYTPSRYGSAQITLQLLISEFNAKPRVCVVTGTCSPKLSPKKDPPQDAHTPPKKRPQGSLKSSYGVSRKKRHLQILQQKASQVIELQNMTIPANLSNPHALSTVLIQQPRLRDLHQGRAGSDKSRLEKETLFQQVIQQNVAEEEANQLRWQVHLGSDPMSAEQRHIISQDRQSSAVTHQVMRGRPDLAAEYQRGAALTGSRRVLRCADQAPGMQPRFDLYLNDLWANRERALRRFQQTARRVLLRGRADSRLRALRTALQPPQPCESSHEEVGPPSTHNVLFYDFPPYPAEPDGSVVQDLGSHPPKPAAALLRHQLNFQDLKVPQHFRLMAYQAVRSRGASAMSLPCQLARPLRTGAEEELGPQIQSDAPGAALGQTLSISRQGEPDKSAGSRMMQLRPPQTLLDPPDLHPMHVFNPSPGLVAFKRLLSYSEIDLEFHLCPLAKYPGHQEGARGTARKDMIRGVVTWRKFPAVSLSAPIPTSGGCRPRWCDPFSEDLLPERAPPALSSLPAMDKENVAARNRDEEETKVWLTPDMVRAEFTAMQSEAKHDGLDSCEQPMESPVVDKVRENLKQMKVLSHNSGLILG